MMKRTPILHWLAYGGYTYCGIDIDMPRYHAAVKYATALCDVTCRSCLAQFGHKESSTATGRVPPDLAPRAGPKENNMRNSKVIVRTYSAGVFYGTLKSFEGKEVILTDARRLWYWAGAMTLSCLAVHGTTAPELCKFPVAVSSIVLTEVIEIIQTEEKAQASIEGVPIWHV